MITYRSATIDDINLIYKLANRIWRESYINMISENQINYMIELMYAPKTIETEMNIGVIWKLIYLDDLPIGYLAVTPEGEQLKLNKLYIEAGLQGRGYGQLALKYVIEFCKEKKYKTLYLTVNKGNTRAIRAYEKSGFERTDSKVFDIGGGFVMDDYIYSFQIPLS